MYRPLLLAAGLTAPGLSACATLQDTRTSLADQVRRHVAAVDARNLADVEATITTGADLLLVLPSGRMTRSRSDYLAFHEMLFANRDWTMTFEQLAVQQLDGYGQALYRVTFDADGPGPAPANPAFLTLGFRLENGEWRLVHDQNTAIVQ